MASEVVALLDVMALVFFVAGARMPREHGSVVTATFKASRAAVWVVLTGYAAMPSACPR
jgi:ABC-type antimicrobial peptide transport system permease subunit